jgi:hypothetical protein
MKAAPMIIPIRRSWAPEMWSNNAKAIPRKPTHASIHGWAALSVFVTATIPRPCVNQAPRASIEGRVSV